MSVPVLANAELAIMELLWESDRLTARQIRESLYPDATSTRHGTVQRLLQRLEDKGFLVRDRDLAVHLFAAAVTRETYATARLEHLTDSLTGGSLAPLLTHLVEQRRISRTEIERLRAILDEPNDAAADDPASAAGPIDRIDPVDPSGPSTPTNPGAGR
ncbi:MAG: BlaI/MecI/CopY family transcriptional regulator [Phycisphaerales bacterium]